MEKLILIGKILVPLITVITVSVPLYKRVIRPYLRSRRITKEQHKVFEQQLLSMPADIQMIKKQVYPNGGSSIFDLMVIMSQRLTRLEQKQKLASQFRKEAYWESDKEGKWIYVSPELCKIINRSESELLGHSWVSCLCKDDVNRITEEMDSAAKELRNFDENFCFVSGIKRIKVRGQTLQIIDKNVFIGSYGFLSLTEQ